MGYLQNFSKREGLIIKYEQFAFQRMQRIIDCMLLGGTTVFKVLTAIIYCVLYS